MDCESFMVSNESTKDRLTVNWETVLNLCLGQISKNVNIKTRLKNTHYLIRILKFEIFPMSKKCVRYWLMHYMLVYLMKVIINK